MNKEFIIGDVRPFRACHASTLAECADGTIVAAWFGGTAEKDPDTAIWLARRQQGVWTAPERVAKVARLAHWNPVLFAAPDGILWLWFKVGVDPMQWSTWVITSPDCGVTWSQPRELVPGDVGGRGPVKNKPIALHDGAWLAPASREYPDRWDVFVDRSEDGGYNWQATPPLEIVAGISGPGVIQPSVWEGAPGRLGMLMRSTGGVVYASHSHDGGRTWSAAAPTGLPNNNSGLDVARLPDGVLALVYNPVSGNWAARTPLSLALSSDDGVTWRRWRDLETAPGEYSYPAIIATRNGLAATYTWNRERIAFVAIKRSEIPVD